jgi:hypothetical protein
MAVTVTEANRLDRKQLALRWYWEPKVTLTVMAAGGNQKGKIIETPSLVERYCDSMETAWDVLASALRGESSGVHWDVCCLRSKAASVVTGFLALFLLPVWLGTGLFTFGLLWPPQVRRWLFRPTNESGRRGNRRYKTKSTTRGVVYYDDDDLTRAKLSQLRADVMDLKGDLGFLKDVIYRAVVDEDRI